MKVATFICRHCKKKKCLNTRLKGKQEYCGDPPCQRARKAEWKREKLLSDPSFAEAQRDGCARWRRNKSAYWKGHRQRNPKQAQRNLLLQRKRNLLRRQRPPEGVIAKVDAFASYPPDNLPKSGEYWLVPVIAKVDALKVNLEVIME